MLDSKSFATSSSDAEKAASSRRTGKTSFSTAGSRPTEKQEQDTGAGVLSPLPTGAELRLGPKIIGVQEQKTSPQWLRRGLTMLWRRFTSPETVHSRLSEFSDERDDSATAASRSSRWQQLDAETCSTTGELDLVVEDTSWDLSDDPSDNGASKPMPQPSNGARSCDVSEAGPAAYQSSVPSVLSWLPAVKWGLTHFFAPHFEDNNQEASFRREWWAQRKRLGVAFSLFLVLNYILYLTINKDLDSLFSRITYFTVAGFFTVPLPFLIAWDIPLLFPLLFQLYFSCSVWIWGLSELIQSRVLVFHYSFQSEYP